MRPPGVIVEAPLLDDDLGFLQRVEDLAVEQLVAEAGILRTASATNSGPLSHRI